MARWPFVVGLVGAVGVCAVVWALFLASASQADGHSRKTGAEQIVGSDSSGAGYRQLRIQFIQPPSCYASQDVKTGFWAYGGRPPYVWSLSGSFPRGMTVEILEVSDPAWPTGHYQVTGRAGPVGAYEVSMKVVDADGQIAVVSGVLDVHELPIEIGELVATNRVYNHLQGEVTIAGDSNVVMSTGWSVSTRVQLQPNDVPAGTREYEVADCPDWLKFEADGHQSTLVGTPIEAGVFKLKVTAIGFIAGVEKQYPLSCEIVIEVGWVQSDSVPEGFGKLKIEPINCQISETAHGGCWFESKRPRDWTPHEWEVNAAWKTSVESLNNELPKGLKARDGLGWGEGQLAIPISGQLEEVGEWELEIKIIANVLYVEAPIEFVGVLRITVAALRDDQIPESLEPPKTRSVLTAVGEEFVDSVSLKHEFHRPLTWSADMHFSCTVEWLIDDVDLPPGVSLSTNEYGLVVRGVFATAGEVELQVKAKVRIKYIDKDYEVTQRIKFKNINPDRRRKPD